MLDSPKKKLIRQVHSFQTDYDTKRKTQAGKESRDETKTLHFC